MWTNYTNLFKFFLIHVGFHSVVVSLVRVQPQLILIIVLSLSTLSVLFTNTHKLKQVTQVEKFNLKNQTLKVLEKKLEQQLQQKKEAGKAEYEVDSKSVKNDFF